MQATHHTGYSLFGAKTLILEFRVEVKVHAGLWAAMLSPE